MLSNFLIFSDVTGENDTFNLQFSYDEWVPTFFRIFKNNFQVLFWQLSTTLCPYFYWVVELFHIDL